MIESFPDEQMGPGGNSGGRRAIYVPQYLRKNRIRLSMIFRPNGPEGWLSPKGWLSKVALDA